MISWQTLAAGFGTGLIVGGGGLKVIELLIKWREEKREQRRDKTAHEKDRPRFRVDIAKGKTSHALVPALVVKILSLGGLPLAIDDGEIFIEASHYPDRVQPQQLSGREISPFAPIELEFSLPPKLVNPGGIGKPVIKLKCRFSYTENKERHTFSYEKTYAHAIAWFE